MEKKNFEAEVAFLHKQINTEHNSFKVKLLAIQLGNKEGEVIVLKAI